MIRLFLIRHGEPTAGWGDADNPGLNSNGWEQAEAAGRRLAEYGKFHVISSPMQRCRDTAKPYARFCELEPMIESRVSEVATPGDVTDRKKWLADNFAWRPGSAPRVWDELDPRLLWWRDSVIEAVRACDRDTAIFSHFIAINAIVGFASESDQTIVFRPNYASITELALEGGDLCVVRLGEEMQQGEVR